MYLRSSSLMSLAAWMPSSLRFFSICLLRAMAARSSADEAQPMAMARTAWLATRGSAVPLACSRPVVARTGRRARAHSRTRASPKVRLAADAPGRLTTPDFDTTECYANGSPRTKPGSAIASEVGREVAPQRGPVYE
ncbi:hypothetical protein K1T71_010196 [Dendrolimus kikuchii]|uniref:Uncharacterized protein n=1 Tax=Dendrolimus kikuchii TaxID=765133 RepID=A0ACC1CRK9_9NEOP|nr:hypothetical protein K1T71_010196 [Dendrolimus kikuchii]